MEQEWKDRSDTVSNAHGLAGASSHASARLAYLYAAGMILTVCLAIPWADMPLAGASYVAPFLSCAAIGIPLMIWLMLSCHGAAFGDLGVARLGSAFLFLAATQVAVFLALALPSDAIGEGWGELEPWARVSGQLGFAAIVAVQGLAGWHEAPSAMHKPRFGAVVRLAALVLAGAAVVAAALIFSVPLLSFFSPVAQDNQLVLDNWPAITYSLLALAAIVATLITRMVARGQRTTVDVWLMAVLVGAGLEVLTGLMWHDRASLGWCVGRTIGVAAHAAMLCAVLQSSARLYYEQARANSTLGRLAMLDSLTGLSNRRDLDAELERAWKRAKREDEWLSLIFIDLDDFKQYNDLYGHMEGDACLRAVSAVLETHRRRPDDLSGRYGGDEFVLLLYGADPVGAQEIAASIRTGVEAANIPHAVSRFGRVMVTTGVASVRPAVGGSSAEDLLRSSDESLYRAKRAASNAVRRQANQALAVGIRG